MFYLFETVPVCMSPFCECCLGTMHLHSTPLTTSPTSFGKYVNLSIILFFVFVLPINRISLSWPYLTWNVANSLSIKEGPYSRPKEESRRPYQCLWDNCTTSQCTPVHCRQRRGPSLSECVKVACSLPTSPRIWAWPVLQFQQSSQSGSSPTASRQKNLDINLRFCQNEECAT